MPQALVARSLNEFLDHVSDLSSAWRSDLWFRGHADENWPLIPGLYRFVPRQHETVLRDEFKRRAIQLLLENPPSSPWEWYFLMQHYGMPTRLLDWSAGGLFGLYFALRENDGGKDAAVWVLDPFWLNEVTVAKRAIFFASDSEVDKHLPSGEDDEIPSLPIALEPPHVARRIAVQRGCFTIHGSIQSPLDELLASLPAAGEPHLQEIVVSAGKVKEFRRELARCGIVGTSVFPDLEGLSRELKWAWLGVPVPQELPPTTGKSAPEG